MALRPLYTTRGEHAAYFENGYLFNLAGEWIGFVDLRNGQVYSVLGDYVGYMSKDGRILRKRVTDHATPRQTPPPRPARPRLPATVALAPLMGDLTFDTIDMLEEMPERLHTLDAGELPES